MKRGSTLFLKLVLLLIGAGVLTALLWFPQTEGRNRNSDPISLYFNDPFLAYIYATFISFFVGLYQAFRLLGYIEQNKAFSEASVKALRNIKYCSLIFGGLIAAAIPVIMYMAKQSQDDAAGGIMMGLVIIFASLVVATAAAVFQRLLQNAVDIKSENDLTV